MQSIKSLIREVDFEGQSFISINSMTNDQLLALFELGRNLELQNRGNWQLYPDAIVSLLFFQPSTRTRMSFETAMYRMGGNVIVENTPQTTSSIAKEESLADMLRCVSQYANVIVLRHPNDVDAREGASYSTAPVINGGWGHWEHPTQALLDLYTLWRKFGHIDGLKVTVAAADMIEARTGHSMAQGLARLGAEVTIASPKPFPARSLRTSRRTIRMRSSKRLTTSRRTPSTSSFGTRISSTFPAAPHRREPQRKPSRRSWTIISSSTRRSMKSAKRGT